MAKKKTVEMTAVPMMLGGYSEPTVYDNRGPGVMDLPNDSLRGCRYPKGKMQFVDAIAPGESAERPDVLLQTANGSQRSQGGNPDQQRNWSPSDAWAEDKKWNGGNLTGM